MTARLLLGLFLAPAALSQTPAAERVSFDRQIRPILSNHCFGCHGPDEATRKADLRLDDAESAQRAGAIVPGDPAASTLLRRVGHADVRKRMPPRSAGAALTSRQIELLRTWIAQGAKWQQHWAFEPLVRPRVPRTSASWVRNEIDEFVALRLHRAGMVPAPRADARTLARRLHVDLTGLPPTRQDVEAFASDPSESAWQRHVDRLLSSPHHAERLATYWLDLVRYGDSCGIHGDQEISMSPYRDYVIRSFHENKPFDVFTREQLAGDLLENPTRDQLVASGYNRLNPKTAEGGAQDKEYLAKYAADRVRTTASVWLGVTLGCAECHDHKFDPFTTKDFYRFAAFFADLEGKGYYGGANVTNDWGPKIIVPDAYEKGMLDGVEADIAKLEREIADADLSEEQRAWERQLRDRMGEQRLPRVGPWRISKPFRAKSLKLAHETAFAPERRDASRDGWREQPAWTDGKVHKLVGSNTAHYLCREVHSDSRQKIRLRLGSDDSLKVWLNGELAFERFVTRGVAADQDSVEVDLSPGRNELMLKVSNGGGGYGFYFAIGDAGPPRQIVELVLRGSARRDAKGSRAVADYFRNVAPSLAATRTTLGQKREIHKGFLKAVTTCLVSRARKTPRVTRVLPRGDWMNESGPVVAPGVPAFLPQPEKAKLDRRDLANWITARDNPLTARTLVNRLWKLLFGHGLARTLDDLGSQGERPTHAQLLDWLASELVASGWNVRHIVRTIVTSETYRQSSRGDASQHASDPENRMLGRQLRFRHDAEVVRDIALSVAGLLNRKVGGRSVRPYQPAGYWSELNFPKRKWKVSSGPALYRRGLYTHWQRTFLHPSLRAFDAPPREECVAERPRSNTPLQALALLNDPSFVEAARVFAERIVRARTSEAARLRYAFGEALTRSPTDAEVAALTQLLHRETARFTADEQAARALTTVGDYRPGAIDAIEHAAWTSAARTLLNLHETITRF